MTSIIGVNNPYGLVQSAGKRKTRRTKRTKKSRRTKKTHKNKRTMRKHKTD